MQTNGVGRGQTAARPSGRASAPQRRAATSQQVCAFYALLGGGVTLWHEQGVQRRAWAVGDRPRTRQRGTWLLLTARSTIVSNAAAASTAWGPK